MEIRANVMREAVLSARVVGDMLVNLSPILIWDWDGSVLYVSNCCARATGTTAAIARVPRWVFVSYLMFGKPSVSTQYHILGPNRVLPEVGADNTCPSAGLTSSILPGGCGSLSDLKACDGS